jgi:hypothetical protein
VGFGLGLLKENMEEEHKEGEKQERELSLGREQGLRLGRGK